MEDVYINIIKRFPFLLSNVRTTKIKWMPIILGEKFNGARLTKRQHDIFLAFFMMFTLKARIYFPFEKLSTK